MNQTAAMRKGAIYVLIAAMLWGLSGVFAQFLFQQRGVQPEWLVALRLFIPGVILLCRAYYKKGNAIFNVWREDGRRMLIYSIFGMMAVQLTFFITVKHSNAATATVLQFINPAIVAVYMSIKLRRTPSKLTTFAVFLSLMGTFFIATHGSIRSLNISPEALAWGIVSAFAAAFYLLYSIDLIRKWDGTVVVGWAMFTGGMALSILYPPWNVSGVWDIYTFAATVYIFIFGSLITFYLFLMGVQIIGSEKGSILGCAEPLAAALFSMLFLNVEFGVMDWLGTFCIILTVFLLTRDR